MCHPGDPVINSFLPDAYRSSHTPRVSLSWTLKQQRPSTSQSKISVKLMNNIFTILCLSCLLYQLHSISNMYFQYRVAEQISIDMPTNYSSQSVSLCINYMEILRKQQKVSSLTHEELYQKSPNNSTALIRAEYRLPQSYELNDCFSWQNCTRKFSIDKFTYGNFVCYKYTLRPEVLPFKENMTIESLSVTPAGSGMIYRLWIAPDLMEEASQLKIAAHSSHLFPVKSFSRTRLIVRNLNQKDGRKLSNSFYSSQRRLSVDRLPPPHATRCREEWQGIEINSRTQCLQRCLLHRTIERMGKLPFSVLIKEPINLEIVSHEDLLTNETLSSLLDETTDHCRDTQCNFTPCKSRTVFTRTIEESGLEYTIDFIIPRDPNIMIKTYSILTLFEYITYMMGTVSTYVGVAVIHLNPILLVNSLSGKLNQVKRSIFNVSSSTNSNSEPAAFKKIHVPYNNLNGHESLYPRPVHPSHIAVSRERFNSMAREDKHLTLLLSNINSRLKKLESKI